MTTPVDQVAPKLAQLTREVLFGDVWERPGLSKRDRSLVTVAALVSLYRAEQLPFHLGRALENGLTRDELVEAITHLAFYAGWPNAMTAATLLADVPDRPEPQRPPRAGPGGEPQRPATRDRSMGDAAVVDATLFSLALVVLFVLIGGFFSGSELAVLTLRDSQADRLPGRRGQTVRRLRVDPSRFLASVQVGVTFAGFFASAYGGATLSEPLAGLLTGWGVPAGVAGSVAFVGVTAFISYLSLVLGELVPKRLALQRGVGIALFVSPVLDVVARVSRPIVWLLSLSTNLIVRLLGLDPDQARADVTEEELRDIVRTHGSIDVERRRVLTDVFGSADRQLSAVMVPRTEVDFLPAATSLRAAARQVLDKPHSRYPVIGATVDDIVGVVHLRDLLTNAVIHERWDEERTVGDIARPAPLLPGSKPVLVALAEMRASRFHLAVVVDEYGGTDGIVTMEDIIEELVGEIEDEFDPTRVEPDSSEFDGLAHREELADRIGFALPSGPYETLAGYVLSQLGRIPEVGESFEAHDHLVTVVEMDGRRVARVRVTAALPASGKAEPRVLPTGGP